MVDHETSRTDEGEEQSTRVLTIGRLLEAIAGGCAHEPEPPSELPLLCRQSL
jgi:hypothetical protein